MNKSQVKKKASLIPWLYVVMGLIQAAHSAEEIVGGLWKLSLASVLPNLGVQPGFPNWNLESFAVVNLILVALMLAFSPVPFLNHKWAWNVIWIIAAIEIVNGLIPNAAALITGGYFPGCISGIFLSLSGLMIWIVKEKNGHQ